MDNRRGNSSSPAGALSQAIGSLFTPPLASIWRRRPSETSADPDAPSNTTPPPSPDPPDELQRLRAQVAEQQRTIDELRRQTADHRNAAEARQFADSVIQGMCDLLIVTDPQLQIVTVNDAACEQLGYVRSELVGRPIGDLIEPQPAVGAPVGLLLATGVRDAELTYLTHDGRRIEALVSASPLRDASGKVLAIMTVGKDITQRKQIEAQLLEAKIAAEAANRAKTAFIANMSHEIRTPMTAILGYADLLSFPQRTDAERREWIATIRRNGRHLLSVINDILDLSKIEAGRIAVEGIPCCPQQLVGEVASLLATRAAEKGLAFEVRFLTPVARSIQTDPTRLKQVLLNLVGNAIKFTPSGSVRIDVSQVRAAHGRARLLFAVTDTGVGLSPAERENLFKPFVQADSSTTRKFGGTGLGLAISQRLAELLGGQITVESAPGAGSTFTLSVEPLSSSDHLQVVRADLVKSPPAAEDVPLELPRLSGRALVAEDGPDNQALLRYFLEHAGLEVEVVGNGRDAVERAIAPPAGKAYDVVLMDMQMPEMDGYEASLQLRYLGFRGPIVAVTAHALPGDREKCIACGCDDFTAKPIDPRKLLDIVGRYVRWLPDTPTSRAVETRVAATPADAAIKPVTPGGPLREGTFVRLVQQFVGRLPQRAEGFRAAFAAGDRAQLRVLAHQLKGAAGGYGFATVAVAAMELEKAAADPSAELHEAVSAAIRACETAATSPPGSTNAA